MLQVWILCLDRLLLVPGLETLKVMRSSNDSRLDRHATEHAVVYAAVALRNGYMLISYPCTLLDCVIRFAGALAQSREGCRMCKWLR